MQIDLASSSIRRRERLARKSRDHRRIAPHSRTSAKADEQPDVAVRPMLEIDISRVLKVERAAYEFPWSEGIFRDCLRVGYCCWVLEVDVRIRGFGIMQVIAGEAHILNLCIEPSVQNRGLGRILLQQLLRLAVRHGADTTFLEVRPSNPAARRLYSTAGFHEVGTRRAYYPAAQGREDAIIMARASAPP